MIPHDDEAQDSEMIKSVLQKIVDDMNSLEANRIMPEHKKPGYAMGGGIPNPEENKAELPQQAEPETQTNQHEPLSPEVLKDLMEKAEHADESGATPEDEMEGLHPHIAAIVAMRRKEKHPK